MIINRILKMPLLKMPLLRIGDKLMERNGRLVTIDLDIGDVQPRHLRLRLTPGTVVDQRLAPIGTWTHICTDPNIWDLHVYDGYSSSWGDLFMHTFDRISDEIIEVIDGDCTGVTDMFRSFYNCKNIRSVGPLYNTESIQNGQAMFACDAGGSIVHVSPFDTSGMAMFNYMFYKQSKLKEIPLLDTSNSGGVSYMYYGCVNVERGILAAYNEMISHGRVGNHYLTFHDCGINTESGRAELAQIPDDWKS